MNNDFETALFGHGFIGKEYTRQFPETIVASISSKYSPSNNVLYMRSTVHNYHPKDGDLYIDVDTNLIHFLQVLEANSHKKDMVFNLVSSWFVYGATKLPATEDGECHPKGFYSITARAREQLLISYAETFGLKYRILRLGNVLGVGDTKVSAKKNALQWMIKVLANGGDVGVYKSDAIRDFIDVRDCVRAIRLVIEKGELNAIYNVSNGEGLRVSELINAAHRTLGYRGTVKTIDVPEFHKTVQTPTMWMDVSKLKNLGYVKQHDVKTTVEEIANYYAEQ